MIILGIDPGTATTGYGVVESALGKKLETSSKGKKSFSPLFQKQILYKSKPCSITSCMLGNFNAQQALIEKQSLDCLDFGCIETSKDLDFAKRLSILSQGIRKVIKIYQPQLVAIESIFFFRNQKTVIRVSQAIGVIAYTIQQAGALIKEYSPQEVKKFFTQNGWAKKDEVQKEIKELFKIKEKVRPDDAVDALAMAVYAACKASKGL